MSRVIKFRAWNPQGNMLNPFEPGDGTTNEKILFEEKWPLMQFTGLLDKNGREIYEGDILLLKEDAGMCVGGEIEMTAQVAWDYRQLAMIEEQHDQWEVIGNIYENKDLLV